jgi:hypothetical protein
MRKAPFLLAILLWSLLAPMGRAALSYVQDLPFQPSDTLPEWLQVRAPEAPVDNDVPSFASSEFLIKAPAGTGDLAVTLYFTEVDGGSLRVFWQGTGQGSSQAVTLSDNLYEDVAMPNQRTLLIPKSIIGTGGVLTIQASSSDAGISRIEWNWVSMVNVATTDPAAVPALLRTGNQMLRTEDVTGDPPPPSADRIQSKTIAAVIRQEPIRIEEGVDFTATIVAAPTLARMEVQLLGVPLDRNVAFWINGTAVNQVALEAPNLADAGYQWQVNQSDSTASPKAIYVGWRKGTVLIPAQMLIAGENHFHFQWVESPDPAAPVSPLALKDFIVQLSYDTPVTTPTTEQIVP